MLSVREPTWDKEKRMHTCCGSTHSYHRSMCPIGNGRVPGRKSDPIVIKIQHLKEAGYTSREVARQLGLALEEVNDLWVL